MDRPQAAPVADRPGRALARLHRVPRQPAHRLVGLGLDRSDRDPRRRTRHRPVRRPRPVQPAGGRDQAPRAGPVLPLDHLSLPAGPVPRLPRGLRVDRQAGVDRRGRARHLGEGRAGAVHRRHRGHRHQHRPRAGPQEGEPRALAVQDRPGAELLRALLHRAQPRPPRAGGDSRGPRQQPDGRELLPVLAALGGRVGAQRVADREAALRPQGSAPVPHRQRRTQRLADVGCCCGGRWSPSSEPGSCPTW